MSSAICRWASRPRPEKGAASTLASLPIKVYRSNIVRHAKVLPKTHMNYGQRADSR